MPTFRPSINTDDGYFKKVVKYIPAEIIAAYTFAMGLITAKDCNGEYVSIFPWIFFILLLFTPIYMYISVIDNPAIIDSIKKRKQAIFHAVIALIAFALWAYALGDIPMVCYIGESAYKAVVGSLLLAAFSLIVPLLERVFLK